MGNQEQLTDDNQEQLTDDDSDQELRRVLKHLGVMRVGGRWQKRGEGQEERASPNDSLSSSENVSLAFPARHRCPSSECPIGGHSD